MTRKNNRGLTDMQTAFAREYAIKPNGTKAAIKAGYSETGARVTATRLLTNDAVLKEIARLQQHTAIRKAVTADSLVDECDEMIEASKHGNPVTDRYGNPTGDHVVSFSGWGKGLELKSKLTGLLTEKRDVTTRRSLLDMSMEELEQERRLLEEELARHNLDPDGKPLATKH